MSHIALDNTDGLVQGSATLGSHATGLSDGTSIAGLAIGHTGHLPSGPMVIFRFYGLMFFVAVVFVTV